MQLALHERKNAVLQEVVSKSKLCRGTTTTAIQERVSGGEGEESPQPDA